MKKTGILNVALVQAVTQARHGDAIVLCDANMPIPNECNVIDLSLVRGVPSLLQTMTATLNELVAERYEVFHLMPQYNAEMYQRIRSMLAPLPSGTVDKETLMSVMKTAKAVVRTGDFGSCCTMVLYSASGMDRYVERFELSFPSDEK